MAAWSVGIGLIILKYNPALLAERLGPRKGAKGWDLAIMSLLGLLQLARYIVAGLDLRSGWSSGFSWEAQAAGLLVAGAGHALFLWAMRANAYFSQIVRIQKERQHPVATGGPYGLVRHPGYVGAILFELGVAVLLGSWGAVGISLASSLLLVVRTALEDRLLQAELPGYAAYTEQVRWRLLPGVW